MPSDSNPWNSGGDFIDQTKARARRDVIGKLEVHHEDHHHHYGAAPVAIGDAPGVLSVDAPVEPPGGIGPVRGRDELLRGLARWRGRRRQRVRVLHGLGGCGKTTVAWRFAQRAVQDGVVVWWVSAATTSDLHAGMRQITERLGAQPAEVDRAWSGRGSATDLLWRLLEACQKRWILIIDNADDLELLAGPEGSVASGTGWLRPVRSRRGMVVVTSRDGDQDRWGSWCDLRLVGALTVSDAAQVLLDHVGERAGTVDDARALANRLGGLPLALRLAGAYLAEVTSSPWQGSMATFNDYRDAVDALDNGKVQPGSDSLAIVVGTWDLSLDLLERRGYPQARPLLRLLSMLGEAPIPSRILLDPPTLRTSPMFGDLDGSRLWELLRALARYGLVDVRDQDPSVAGPTLHLHPLIRSAARYQAKHSQQQTLYRTLAAALLHQASEKAGSPEAPAQWPVWQLLTPHAVHLLHALADVPKTGSDATAYICRSAMLSCQYLLERGIYPSAKTELRTVLDTYSKVLGGEHPDILAAQHQLAVAQQRSGDLRAAEAEFRAVLGRERQILGEENPRTLATQRHLADVLYRRGDLRAAEAEFRAILSRERQILGDDNVQTLATRHSLARVSQDLGFFDVAEAEFRRVYDARRSILGEEHPATLASRHRLAVVLSEPNSIVVDDEIWTVVNDEICTVVKACERILGEDHPETLAARHDQKLISWRFAGKITPNGANRDAYPLGYPAYLAAISGLEAVYDARCRVLGEDHPDTLTTRHELVVIRCCDYFPRGPRRRRAEEAEMRAVHDARLRTLGENHPDTLDSRAWLAGRLRERGQLDEAGAEYRAILAISRSVLGEDHPRTLEVMNCLKDVQRDIASQKRRSVR